MGRTQQTDANQIPSLIRPHPLISARNTQACALQLKLLLWSIPSGARAALTAWALSLPGISSSSMLWLTSATKPALPTLHSSKDCNKQTGTGGCSTLFQHLQDLMWNQRSKLTPANKMNLRSRINHISRKIKPSSSICGTRCSCGRALQSLLNKNACFCGFAISALFSTSTEE